MLLDDGGMMTKGAGSSSPLTVSINESKCKKNIEYLKLARAVILVILPTLYSSENTNN